MIRMTKILRMIGGVAVICAALAACTLLPDQDNLRSRGYDVRQVAVLGAANVPLVIVDRVNKQLQQSIAATRYDDVRPRVVITVNILKVQKDMGIHKTDNIASVLVKATYVDNGTEAGEGGFEVSTQALNSDVADQALAEKIAGRVRYLFGLARP
jgi:hypothetical protein